MKKNKLNMQAFFTVLFLMLMHQFSYGQGSTYAGPYESSAPITLNGASDQTISYLAITNAGGNCITLKNCTNIRIEYCKLGPSLGEGVSVENCSNITIVNCSFSSIRTGLYAGTSKGIRFEYNDVQNVKGPMPKGQMVQFDKVSGAGNSISFNVSENIAGQSAPEDVVSLFQSTGTESSPIKVANNWIRGGGPSTSGGGIMCGDYGGSYVLVENNILVNPGQYGLALTSGHHITVRNNKVYSARFSYNNIGLYAWNMYDIASYANTVSNNELNYTSNSGGINDFWNAGNMGVITGWDTNRHNSELNASILPDKIIGRAIAMSTETIAPQSQSNELKIFTSSADGVFSIESEADLKGAVVQVFNIKGQKVTELKANGSVVDVSTNEFAAGVYIVKVTLPNSKVSVKKVVVDK